MKTKILALALALAPFAASAAPLSYTYVEGGWNKLHIDDELLDNPEADGGFVRGSYDIGSGVNVFGGVSRVSEDFRLDAATRLDIDLTQYELGLGYHQSMSDRVDFIAELAYTRLDTDIEVDIVDVGRGSDSVDMKGGRGALGVRGQFNDSLEGLLKVNYYAGGDFDETFTGVVGAQFKFNPTWGITAEIEHGELLSTGNDTRYQVGVRASF
ncbi:MAG TPA: outer membrane beta-barrel protein [Lysobacter sp.]|nr:outer membrane beta-barrel protein [Lysobacter sp.]